MADFHPISISHQVADLASARDFMTEVLGFALAGAGDAWALLDNGSLAIRLVHADEGAPPLRVELLTQDVDATVDQLGTRPEVGARGDLVWPSPDRCEVSLSVGGWLTLVVLRVYDEDQRGVLPGLPVDPSTGYPPKSCELGSLVTHKRFVEAALAGRKTQQRRDGLYAYPNETFTLDGIPFRVTAVERQRLSDITEDDARREGFPGLGAYKDLILRMHTGMTWDDDTLVWVHSFERISST